MYIFQRLYLFFYVTGFSFWRQSWLYRVFSTWCFLQISFLTVNEIYNFLYLALTFSDKIQKGSITIHHIFMIYRFIVMILNRDQFLKLIDEIEDDNFYLHSSEAQAIRDSGKKFLDTAATVILCILVTVWVPFLAIPLMDGVENNFPFGLVFLVEAFRKSSIYPMIYVLNGICMCQTGLLMIIEDLFIGMLILNLAKRFDVLNLAIRDLLNSNPNRLDSKRLMVAIVKQHTILFRFKDELESLTHVILLIQFSFSALIVCLIAYDFSRSLGSSDPWGITMLQYLQFTMVEVFFLCYCGEELTNESIATSDAVHMSNWYEFIGDKFHAAFIQLVIQRSHRSVELKAGGLFTLRLATFGVILKWSYSLLTLLINSND